MEHAKRFRALLGELGLKHSDAAKLLHVSLRTLQNWLSGRHEVPYAAYKLLRLMRFVELPGQAWAGWHFSRGHLVTPEGRTISGRDGSWWSLLVRQAHCFRRLYDAANLARMKEAAAGDASGLAGAASAPGAGLVSVSTSRSPSIHTDNQNGPIMTPWPTISDFPPLSMPTPEPAVSASASALTPCCALPWTPTCGETAQAQTPKTAPALPGLGLPPLADSWLNRANLAQRPKLAGLPSSASSSAGKSPGYNAKPASPDLAGGVSMNSRQYTKSSDLADVADACALLLPIAQASIRNHGWTPAIARWLLQMHDSSRAAHAVETARQSSAAPTKHPHVSTSFRLSPGYGGAPPWERSEADPVSNARRPTSEPVAGFGPKAAPKLPGAP